MAEESNRVVAGSQVPAVPPSPLYNSGVTVSSWLAARHAAARASSTARLEHLPLWVPAAAAAGSVELPTVALPAAAAGARPHVRALHRNDSDAARRARRHLMAAAALTAAAKELIDRSRRRLADVQRELLPAVVARPPPPAAAATAASNNGGRKQGAGGGAAAAARPGDVYEALKAIPNLGRDDLLKSYSALVRDDDRSRFRALMALPLDMRKDWLLMEIGNLLQ